MTKTTAELRESVAEELRVKSVDLPLDSETADKIDRAIGRTTTFLREAGLIWWVDNAIPDAAEDAMVLMVAARACRSVGKVGQGYEGGWADGQTMLTRIKPSAAVETVQADYY